ncbi:MAG: GGDEF domain-containing phosphodiesterase [Eubacteriales bacterium]|nr:GGDEF domain-containing phosphodiesterase [Eubacteriales bacterium]
MGSYTGVMRQEPFLAVNSASSLKLYAVYEGATGRRVYAPQMETVFACRFDASRDLLDLLQDPALVSRDDLADVTREIAALRGGRSDADFYARLRMRGGGEHLFRIIFCGYERTDGSRDRCVLFIDAEKERALHNELKYLTQYDPLTGLFNQHSFCQRAQELIRADADEQYVIIRTNIEKFKIINEMFGMERGDALLCRMVDVSRELQTKLAGRSVFGRIRADIFACCCPNTEDNIRLVIEKTQREIAHYIPDYETRVDFGLYVVEDLDEPVEHMVDRANMAMQTIRGNYLQNYAYYDDALRKNVLGEQYIVSEMGAALRRGQFHIVIQPKCDIRTGEPIGGEVLVRWKHPSLGMIPPDRFVPIFEKTNFIYKLDCFVWEEACRELCRQREAGLRVLPLSVNLSRMDLQRPDLLETLNGLVRRYEIPTEWFKLEITESGETPDVAAMLHTVDTLHEAGFEILLDDFGSAYSTFNVLHGIRLGGLKIDLRSLTARSLTGERVEQLLASFVYMADRIGIPTVIEGVETLAQVDCARQAGIRYAQGYYFYKPLPAGEYRALLAEE